MGDLRCRDHRRSCTRRHGTRGAGTRSVSTAAFCGARRALSRSASRTAKGCVARSHFIWSSATCAWSCRRGSSPSAIQRADRVRLEGVAVVIAARTTGTRAAVARADVAVLERATCAVAALRRAHRARRAGRTQRRAHRPTFFVGAAGLAVVIVVELGRGAGLDGRPRPILQQASHADWREGSVATSKRDDVVASRVVRELAPILLRQRRIERALVPRRPTSSGSRQPAAAISAQMTQALQDRTIR